MVFNSRRRTRTFDKSVVGIGDHWYYGSGYYQYPFTAIGGQTTLDSVHRWPPRGGVTEDVGGNFLSEKFEVSVPPVIEHRSDHWAAEPYRGPISPTGSSYLGNYLGDTSPWLTGSYPAGSATELDAAGTTAISRCAPTNPHASLSVTIGELRREGLPALPALDTLRRRKVTTSGTAGEYLNYEFGVKPLISDLTKFATAVRDADSILKQYYRDSGKPVRRRYVFPTETNSTVGSETGVAYPALTGYDWHSYQGERRVSTISTRRRWFSGAFVYHVADSESMAGIARAAQAANHLLGIGITPATLYNLTPWSWAFDWFTNTGDVMNNLSMMMADGLVMRYGYMMEEISNLRVVELNGLSLRETYGAQIVQSKVTYSYMRKYRRFATPFGFGLELGGLTPRQWAITAALGLSRNGSSYVVNR